LTFPSAFPPRSIAHKLKHQRCDCGIKVLDATICFFMPAAGGPWRHTIKPGLLAAPSARHCFLRLKAHCVTVEGVREKESERERVIERESDGESQREREKERDNERESQRDQMAVLLTRWRLSRARASAAEIYRARGFCRFVRLQSTHFRH
jgi:hypothetical protein